MTRPAPVVAEKPSGPWWKYGYVWLVVGGPLVVILASIVTVTLAVRTADVVVDPNYYRAGVELNKHLQHPEKSMAPAQALRNHTATPDQDLPGMSPK